MNNEQFAARLTTLRQEAGLKQNKASRELGVTAKSLNHYEKGRRLPNADFLYRAAELYNVTVDYLLGLTDLRTPQIGKVGELKATLDEAKSTIDIMLACTTKIDNCSFCKYCLYDSECSEIRRRLENYCRSHAQWIGPQEGTNGNQRADRTGATDSL